MMKGFTILLWILMSGIVGLKAQTTYFVENFENFDPWSTQWTMYDEDGDNGSWQVSERVLSMEANSWSAGTTPENWLVTPAIDLSATDGALYLHYTAFEDEYGFGEHYAVRVSTLTNAVADFTTTIVEETLNDAEMHYHSIDISEYAGQTIYIAFVHYNCSNIGYLGIDDVTVSDTETETTELTNIETTNDETTVTLTVTPNTTGVLHYVLVQEYWASASVENMLNYNYEGAIVVTAPEDEIPAYENTSITISLPIGQLTYYNIYMFMEKGNSGEEYSQLYTKNFNTWAQPTINDILVSSVTNNSVTITLTPHDAAVVSYFLAEGSIATPDAQSVYNGTIDGVEPVASGNQGVTSGINTSLTYDNLTAENDYSLFVVAFQPEVGLSDVYRQDFTTLTSGVNSVELFNTKVFPNPAKDVLSINMDGEANVIIMDMTGSIVLNKNIRGNYTIDISSLQYGTYIVKVNELAGKIIVK